MGWANPETLALRFLEKVLICGGDECWPWLASKNAQGYGYIGCGNKMEKAHRVSYQLFVGPLLPTEKVLHKCDNPPCVRWSHLFKGTQLINVRDCIAKGRFPDRRGERNGRARLSREMVEFILMEKQVGKTNRELAEILKIPLPTVAHVAARHTWQ